jgi:DHA1 family multidrug resistance protein-like MFS transporter
VKSPPLEQSIQLPWQRTLYILFFAQMMTGLGFQSIFPFLPLYVGELGSSTGVSTEFLAGLVYSAQGFALMLASPIWGMLADKYSRKLMVVRSTLGGAVIVLLMAFVRSAEELVLLRAIQGLITGTLAASNALVAASVPRARTGYAMGLLQAGQGIGVALGPMIGGLVADFFGYAAAFYVTSALLFLSGVTVFFGVHEEFVPAEALHGESAPSPRWRQIISMPGVLMTYTMRYLYQMGRMMIIPIIPLFILVLLAEDGRVNAFTGLVMGIAAATTTVSAFFLGRLGDRIGHRKVIIGSSLLAGALYLPQSLATQGWHLLMLYGLVGVAMGGLIPSTSALIAQYTLPGKEGAVYGLDNSIQAGAKALAPLLGSGLALWLGLRSTFAAAGIIFLLMAVIAGQCLPTTTPSDKHARSKRHTVDPSGRWNNERRT